MKLSIFLSIVIASCILQPAGAQSQKKLYYSNHWELTVQGTEYYYRTCTLDTIKNQFMGEVNDYLMNDQMVMKGFYSNGQKNGEFVFYYPNGEVESQGQFKDNKRLGVWKYYFPNGKICREVTFSDDNFFVNSFYDASDKKLIDNGTGEWQYEYEWPGLSFSLIVSGHFEDGKKQGEWKCSKNNGDLLYVETFVKDKFRKGNYFENGVKKEYKEEFKNKFLPPYKLETTENFMYLDFVKRTDYPFLKFLPLPAPVHPIQAINDSDTTNVVFTVVEQMAQYPGGFEAMAGHLARNLQYPSGARKMGIQGTVFISFIVNKDGRISDISLVKGIGGGCDEEAIRIVSKFPAWIPGKQNGKTVNSRFVLPIKFKLG